MKNKNLFLLVLFLLLFSSKVSAQDICSKSGYTVLTINGIFTNEEEARDNLRFLKIALKDKYNGEKIDYQYDYNSTHIGGFGDLVDVVRQGVFDPKSDYDLVEMLDDASDKVKTQKLLLVGHSQGNFYANSFYNKVADKDGGVPSSSMGVYSVATPDKYVAGGGKYLTSDTDIVIAAFVGRLKNIMTPNTHIKLTKADGDGHSFSDVYLKYRSKEIVSDIKSSLDKLKTNTTQNVGSPCISPQKITAMHKVAGALLATADYSVKGISTVYTAVSNTKRTLANTLMGLAKKSLALVGFADGESATPDTVEPVVINNTNTEEPATVIAPPQEEIKKENIESPSTSPEIQDNELNTNPTPAPDPVIIRGGGSSGGGENDQVAEIEIPVVDIIPPVITLTGESIVTLELNEAYVELGATATDDTDTTVVVATTGSVDVATVGSYIVTYSAVDKAGNVAIPVIRTVNVIAIPIVDTIPPVITLNGESVINLKPNEVYVELGATVLDNVDTDVIVTNTGVIDTSKLGEHLVVYTATDKAGNTGTATRTVKVTTSIFIPKYTFGTGNGDGRDWQVWIFDGSFVYDWQDTYKNNYLHERFKLKTFYGMYCTSCLERGIFKHDPRQGFESTDFTKNGLESSVQNLQDSKIYNFDYQWDATGYTYTVYVDNIVLYKGYVNVPNMNNDLWTAWDATHNGFNQFPSYGYWLGSLYGSPDKKTGGIEMVITPYRVYDSNSINESSSIESTPISNFKLISSFNLDNFSPKIYGAVNNTDHVVNLIVPYGTDVKNLTPTITLSYGAIVTPSNLASQDFTNPVTYTVTAEDQTTGTYVVTVTVLPNPNPVPPPTPEPDTSLPTIESYTLNGSQNGLTINPIENDLSIVLNTNKNVNWMSIQIEKEGEPSVYKEFRSDSSSCIDGTKICTKVWDGLLSSGGLLKNGNYKVVVHMQDSLLHDYNKYLDSIVTVIGQAI